MRIFVATLLIGAITALAACDGIGSAKPMPLPEARANLLRFKEGAQAKTLCSVEGRRDFRRAVRTFSTASEAAGQSLPTLRQLNDDGAWKLVVLGAVARVVEPSDLRGYAAVLPVLTALPAADRQFGDARAVFEVACPEMMRFYAEAAALAQLSAEAKARKDLSETQRRDHLDQIRSRMVRYEAAKSALERRLRSAGWVGGNGQALRRP